ncbi:hypothetical protein GCM10023232_27090 [Sphingosinicella ginsenosidimutans]
MKLRNDSEGARAVLMKDRSFLVLDPGEEREADAGEIAIIPGGVSIDGRANPNGARLADARPIPNFSKKDRPAIRITLPQPPASLIAKVRDPLDHDGDGHRGGSLKGARSTRARGAARRKAGK